MKDNEIRQNPRVIVVQKLYSQHLNKDSALTFPKHRYKKFIKDVVLGTLERKELIEEAIQLHLGEDISFKKTEKLLIILLHAAIFELLYRPQTSINIIINEYLNSSDFFSNSFSNSSLVGKRLSVFSPNSLIISWVILIEQNLGPHIEQKWATLALSEGRVSS